MELSLRNAMIGLGLLLVSALLITFSITYTNDMNKQVDNQTTKMFDKII